MNTEEALISETKKWLEKAKNTSKTLKPKGKKGSEFEKNIKAYISDSVYFLEKKDYVRSFEAVIWAWAWIEIGRDLEII